MTNHANPTQNFYRRKAEGRGQRAEGKKVSFDTKISPLFSAIRFKAPEFIYGEK